MLYLRVQIADVAHHLLTLRCLHLDRACCSTLRAAVQQCASHRHPRSRVPRCRLRSVLVVLHIQRLAGAVGSLGVQPAVHHDFSLMTLAFQPCTLLNRAGSCTVCSNCASERGAQRCAGCWSTYQMSCRRSWPKVAYQAPAATQIDTTRSTVQASSQARSPPLGGQAVGLGACQEGILRRPFILCLPAPRLERRGLQRAAVGEGQRPGPVHQEQGLADWS